MRSVTFPALVVREDAEGGFTRRIEERSTDELPAGDVLVKVAYSSLNYKDVLSATGNRGVTRRYPHTPGIDAAGIVAASVDPRYAVGDEVIVTSYDLGMNTPGGFGQYIRVPADWVVPLPPGLTLRESMVYGTAGWTAALSILRLLEGGLAPDAGEVLVTGATGGVGSMAVSILARSGYRVVAVSGREDAGDYLAAIGAESVLTTEEASDDSGKALLTGRWAGVVDTVGGGILATAIRSAAYGARVTCCGNAASPDLPLNVYPFILRAVSLVGIDSQNCPMPLRRRVWETIAREWKVDRPDLIVSETTLEGLDPCIDRVLRREHRGRTVVRLPD